jgi:hypothetical protein
MNFSPIELEKVAFLKSKILKHDEHLGDKVLTINLLGVLIECSFTNVSIEDFNYLKTYYAPFEHKNQKVEKAYKVHYCAFKDDKRSLDHAWYSERYPEIHFLPHSEGGLDYNFIIERDYCAYTPDNLTTTYVYGPCPSEGNPDSLDNLFAMLFASCNDQHQALLLHSCAIVKDEKAYVFFGQSGAGKSTLAFHAFKNFKNKIISSDQTLLRVDGEKILAQSTPITIPELERNSPLRTWEPYEVAGIFHLTQEGDAGFKKINSIEFFKLFVGQSSFYLTPFSKQQAYMNLCQQILEKNVLKGEIKYFRDSDFWKLIPS